MEKILTILIFAVLASMLPAQYIVTPSANIAGSWVLYAGRATTTAPIVYGGNALSADPSWSGKIVLVDRQTGGPTIATKLASVVAAGGVAMIVANDQTGAAPILSIGSGNASAFTVIAVSMIDGSNLRSLIGSSSNSVTVQSDRPITPPPPNLELTQILARLDEIKAAIGAPRTPAHVVFGIGLIPPDAVKVGTRVTFMATADGSPPPTFQWTKDGQPIATGSTYVIEAVALTHSGEYGVIATNPLGSASAPPHKLVVIP